MCVQRLASALSITLVLVGTNCARGAGTPNELTTLPPTQDDVIRVLSDSGAVGLRAMLEPCIRLGLHTYPGAVRRFLDGLEPGYTFSVLTILCDETCERWEMPWVDVDSLQDGYVYGRIANELDIVSRYRRGQTIAVPEEGVIDWMIERPDGSEEGNATGKFMDELTGHRVAPPPTAEEFCTLPSNKRMDPASAYVRKEMMFVHLALIRVRTAIRVARERVRSQVMR